MVIIMDFDDKLATFNEETLKNKVNDIWQEIQSLAHLNSQEKPKCYIIGGQPGAGKSTSTDKLEAQYNRNILTIDLDQYRERHPNLKHYMKNMVKNHLNIHMNLQVKSKKRYKNGLLMLSIILLLMER